MTRFRKVVGILLIYALSIGMAQNVYANGCETPLDRSTVVEAGTQDNCGDTSWELQAYWAGYIWDEGEYDATGTCTGGYIKCDCTNVPVSFKRPSKSFSAYYNESEHVATWYWVVTQYLNPQLNGCGGSGDCSSTGYASETDPTWTDENAGWDEEDDSGCYFG